MIAGAVACQGLTDVPGERPCRLWRQAMRLCREGSKQQSGAQKEMGTCGRRLDPADLLCSSAWWVSCGTGHVLGLC